MHPYEERLTDGLQVLRYNLSNTYNTHMDYLDDNGAGHDFDSANKGANRFATILFYLSDVEAGGETVFPRGQAVDDGEVRQEWRRRRKRERCGCLNISCRQR